MVGVPTGIELGLKETSGGEGGGGEGGGGLGGGGEGGGGKGGGEGASLACKSRRLSQILHCFPI